MHPRYNQPGPFFATTKTHKCKSISGITRGQLKLRPIIEQTRTFIYKASKLVRKYLGRLAKNDYTIRDNFKFPRFTQE